MSRRCPSYEPILPAVAVGAICLLFVEPAEAAAPVYFDIFGAVGMLGAFLLGFAAVCVVAARWKPGRVRMLLVATAVCYLPAPFVWLFASRAYVEAQGERERLQRAADHEKSKRMGREALRKFCAGRDEMPVCQNVEGA